MENNQDAIKKMYADLGIPDSYRGVTKPKSEGVTMPEKHGAQEDNKANKSDQQYLIDMLENHSKTEGVDTKELVRLIKEIGASYQKVTFKDVDIKIPKTPEPYVGIETDFEFEDKDKAYLYPHLRFCFSKGVLTEDTTVKGYSGHYTGETTLGNTMGSGILIVPKKNYDKILSLAAAAKLKY